MKRSGVVADDATAGTEQFEQSRQCGFAGKVDDIPADLSGDGGFTAAAGGDKGDAGVAAAQFIGNGTEK